MKRFKLLACYNQEQKLAKEQLAAFETAAALIVKQKEYEKIQALSLIQQEQETARLRHQEQDEEYQRIQHLLQQEKELRAEEQLRAEREKAALENIVKQHDLNMVRTDAFVPDLPKVVKQSKHRLRVDDLHSLIVANVPDNEIWIYTLTHLNGQHIFQPA